MSDFETRLKELIGDKSANSFARKAGIGESLLRKYLTGTMPNIDNALKIANAAGVSIRWLATGEGPKHAKSEPSADDEMPLVPRLDIRASAGAGASGETGEPLEMVVFPRRWLRAAGVTPENARVLTVSGDSMEPTLTAGDLLLVDTSVRRIRAPGLYVLVRDDEIYVKRAERLVNGSIMITSDNSRYAPQEISSADSSELQIAGRVAWYGRSL